MPQGQAPEKSIVVVGASLAFVPSTRNTRILDQTHFTNFAAGYRIGRKVATLLPGATVGPHSHRGAVEEFYIVSGRGTIVVDGESYACSPGDSVLVPPGVVHDLLANQGGKFVVLCDFTTAPGHENDQTPWKQED